MTEQSLDLALPSPQEAKEQLEQALFEIRRVIAGQDDMLERVLVCLLAQGHLLIEGVPGLAKTLTIKTTAGVLGGTFSRVQFTPDLVPSDLVGTRIYRAGDGTFDTELGPVFCNFLLADEINRAPAKVQSALLEVMQERQVTIGHETHRVPDPFLVMATQNPIESEGTYPLPEAQIDRFMLKVVIGYPAHDEELTVVHRQLVAAPDLKQALSLDDLKALQRAVFDIYVDPALVSYAVALATRRPRPCRSRAVHLVRSEPTGSDQPRPVGTRARSRPRTRVRPGRGHPDAHARRAAPPAGPDVPSARRGGRARRHPRPGDHSSAGTADRPRAAKRGLMNARLRLAVAAETMFPPRTPFSSRAWGTSRFPTPLHTHGLSRP